MINRSTSLESIDEIFTKILIEELAEHDHVTNLDSEASNDPNNSSTQWETVANASVSGDSKTDLRVEPLVPPPVSGGPEHWQLRVKYKDGRECTLPLEDDPITIGRDRDNALVLKCDRVSRHHARIELTNRGPRLDDLSSINGILVNGIKVPAAYLKPGDIVKIGSIEIHLNPAD